MPDSRVRQIYPDWANEKDVQYSWLLAGYPISFKPFSRTYDFKTDSQISWEKKISGIDGSVKTDDDYIPIISDIFGSDDSEQLRFSAVILASTTLAMIITAY